MYVSTTEINVPEAMTVSVTEDALAVQLSDGRDISVPLSWYPRLVHATPEERDHWELIGGGQGIHWPDLDEDISVEMLLAGRKSGESRRSFKQWLEAKQAGRGPDTLIRAYGVPMTGSEGEHIDRGQNARVGGRGGACGAPRCDFARRRTHWHIVTYSNRDRRHIGGCRDNHPQGSGREINVVLLLGGYPLQES